MKQKYVIMDKGDDGMVTYDKKERFINIAKGSAVILLFFLFSMFKTLPLEIFQVNYNSLAVTYKIIYSLTVEICLIGIIIVICKEQFVKAFHDLKANHRQYFKDNLKYYLMGIAGMFMANALVQFLGGGISENETAVRSQLGSYPVYTYISAVVLAPILEESTFRLGFRNIFKNKAVFVIVSGFVFGFLHLFGNIGDPLFALYLIA